MTWRKWIVVSIAAAAVLCGALLLLNLRLAPAPSGYSGKEPGVVYYPACGNETLEHGGLTWFPISHDDWETPTARGAWPSGGRGASAAFAMVAPPGPGDDVGTLFVYPGGRAYWVSESGTLDTWLTLVPQSYNWVC